MLKGSIVALITPFLNNKINFSKLEELLIFHLKNKTDGLLLLGTTAESSTLSNSEAKELVQFCINFLDGKIDLLVGVCTNNTQKAIEDCICYEKMGIKNFLVITPYYNKSNDIGIYKHFEEIASNIKGDIIIYHIPNRTGFSLKYELIEKLSKIKNIVGIKEANEDFKSSVKLFSLQSSNFSVYCGNDEFIIPFLSLGARGIINVSGNIIPNQLHTIFDLCTKNDFIEARKIFDIYKDLIYAIFLETNPIGIKEAMRILSINNKELRLPLYSMSKENSIILEKEILKIGKYFNY